MPDVQQSGPLVGRPLTDTQWRALLGDEPAILADTDGSAYRLVTPTGTETAEVGSPTIDSVARVAGFMHRIPAGQTQSIVIPPSTNAAVGRTDLIVVRYDPAVTEEPGPCRLHRIPGVEGSAAAPTPDTSAPGTEDLPLYAVTRRSGQSLTQAAVVDLRTRSGPGLLVPASASLPTNAPLGARVRRGAAEYVREMVGAVPGWRPSTLPSGEVRSSGVSTITAGSWGVLPTPAGAPAGSDYNLRTSLSLPARARVRLRVACWMQIEPTGGSVMELRVGVVVTGTTPTDPQSPTWSGVALLLGSQKQGATGVGERAVELAAGSHAIGVRAYRSGSGAASVSYPALSWHVEEWL